MNHKPNNKLKRWFAIAVSEIILAFILIAIAPVFLNSNKPIWGFLIWFAVPTTLAGSSVYAARKLAAANKARNVFIATFPEYSYLGIERFIDLTPEGVASQIDLLISAKESEEVRELNISLFEILEQTNNEKK